MTGKPEVGCIFGIRTNKRALVVISTLTPGFVGYPGVKFYGRGRGHAIHVVSLAAQFVS